MLGVRLIQRMVDGVYDVDTELRNLTRSSSVLFDFLPAVEASVTAAAEAADEDDVTLSSGGSVILTLGVQIIMTECRYQQPLNTPL